MNAFRFSVALALTFSFGCTSSTDENQPVGAVGIGGSVNGTTSSNDSGTNNNNIHSSDIECQLNLYQFSAVMEGGGTKSLCDYKGDVILIVNTAAVCSRTPQLGDLAQLETTYSNQNFHVLGFWNSQFLGPAQMGDPAEREDARAEYGVNFQLFDPINVNPPDEHPLYTWLKSEDGGGDIRWNFEKFLIARDGSVIKRYATEIEPDQIIPDIRSAL